MERRWKGVLRVICLVILAVLLKAPIEAKAATSVVADSSWKQSGNYYIRLTEDGILYASKNQSGGLKIASRVYRAIGCENKIYYIYTKNYGNRGIYEYNIPARTRRVAVGSSEKTFDLMGYYNGSLYYTDKGNRDKFYTYIYKKNMNTGKITRTSKVTCVSFGTQYKNYLVFSSWRGDPSPTNLYVYNMNTGKATLVTATFSRARIINGRLYYVEISRKESSSGSYKTNIKSCSLSGGNVKNLLSVKVSNYVAAIGSKYAIFSKDNKYYRYYYSGKITRTTSTEYYSVDKKGMRGSGRSF